MLIGKETRVDQSKNVILSVKEKAIKQIAPATSSNDQFLLSRQCFCLYLSNIAKVNGMNNAESSLPLICAQKLLIERDGRLLITIKEDSSFLTQIFNCLDEDIFIWPRISSNYILENYVKNCEMINEKIAQQLKVEYYNQKMAKQPGKLKFVPCNRVK